jgi:glycosyltransferase involved in cell wall biosynthesis
VSLISPSLPSVSLVVVVGDGWETTFRCLLAAVQHSGGARRETIVVDDGSTDDTRVALSRLEGIAVIRNEKPMGFARAANQAGAKARGDVLLFLDRDAEVEPGWLPPVAALFEDPQVAAACPPDGSGLQGAFLAIRTRELRESGGWDESRQDAADALLSSFLERGRRVELVEAARMKLSAPAPAARPPLSVVVPVRDAAATLGPCLEGIAMNLGPRDEIVIADGGSTDETLRSAYEFAARNPRSVRVVPAAASGGLPAAARQGLQAISHPLAVMIHPNVRPPEGFLDGVLQLLAQNPGTQALAIEVPRTGVCLAGPSELLRAVGQTGAETFFQADGVALAQQFQRAGAKLAFVPATP